ncbi:hypothetical protein [Bradyrhizobium sp. LA7.1]|uniref:hypothetical protein n=1 Tax=Bradyrhizobium sp. LA7.1 TaxID=3156324 RepID=UPI0033918A86
MSITRVAGFLSALLFSILAATLSEAAGLTIFTPTGTDPDPLTGLVPLVLRPTETKSVGVNLWSDQGEGFVFPDVTCCVDVLTGVQGNPPGLSMSFPPPILFSGRRFPFWPGVFVTPGQTSLAVMTVAAAAGTPPGQYTAKLSAFHPEMGASEQTIFVNVLGPTPADDTVTPCRTQINNVVVGNGTPPVAEVLPLKSAVDAMFSVNAASGKKSFTIAVAATDNRNGWEIDVTGRNPTFGLLRPDEAVVNFANETDEDKDLWTVNSAACGGTNNQHLHMANGQAGSIRISKADTTSLYVRRDVCGFRLFFCWGYRSEPVAVFTEPPFWSFFGGRVATIRWSISR